MKNMNLGQNFDDFLKEQGDLEEVTVVALKRAISLQLAQQMRVSKLTKTELARRMKTSRAALNRLLDESDPSLTLTTLASAAAALECTVRIRIEPLQR